MFDYALAIIKQGKEKEFQQEACSAGAICYLPYQGRTTKPKHKRKAVMTYRPLFPGYAFAAINKQLPSLRDIQGFKRFFSVDGNIIPIRAREINELKDRENCGEFIDRPSMAENVFTFHVGEHVRIADGALAGYSGVVVSIVNGKHTLDIGNWRATVSVHDLERVL